MYSRRKPMELNRIKPKKMKPDPLGIISKTASNLGKIAKKTHKKIFPKLNPKQILCDELSKTVKKILSKLAKYDVKVLKTIFLDSHDRQIHNTNYEQFIEKCKNNFEIESRFEECYQYSIIHDPSILYSFITNSNMTIRQLGYLNQIINDLHKKLSLDEVDQIFDKEQNSFFLYLTVQYNNPRGGVRGGGRENAYDFFKEWISSIWKEVDPDTPIRASSKRRSTGKPHPRSDTGPEPEPEPEPIPSKKRYSKKKTKRLKKSKKIKKSKKRLK